MYATVVSVNFLMSDLVGKVSKCHDEVTAYMSTIPSLVAEV